MRGQALVDRARRLQMADAHAEKFHLYQSVCVIVDKFMRGAKEATLPGISLKQFNLLKTFYGITIDPGPRADVTPLRHKGRRMYAPRPKEYRPGTPIVMQKRYRKMNDKTTAPLRTIDEATFEETADNGGKFAGQLDKVMGGERHRALIDRGWILVAVFRINPYIGEA
ncbi:hypothetical protein [Providencia phage vB_PreS-Stilesk]|uniref:Uncharacterized protein n=1 Tax=Providencia phage vB_PreS-Stilesk TaxID=2761110 RepID=A0A7G5B147_9CAUD|nr:hypothetical protein JT352_gp41 [Providencia phage vB_PreS-Stilesk]QMV30020.1 hypothetical protein [Providencia phage vB_PreS-Stilesk]